MIIFPHLSKNNCWDHGTRT